MSSTAVVIAAYNEEQQIVNVINRVKKIKQVDIVVVNDGSKDKTSTLAHSTGVVVLDHVLNMGKGAATRTGCDYALKKGYKQLVLIDGDGQHEPEDIPRFLEALKKVDIVFGYRKVGKVPFIYRVGNWGLSMMSKILFGMFINDTQSGFRAFTRKAYKQIRWQSRHYEMESEMIYRAKGLKYKQLEIKNIYAEEHKGVDKGTTITDGIKIGLQMLRWKLLGD